MKVLLSSLFITVVTLCTATGHKQRSTEQVKNLPSSGNSFFKRALANDVFDDSSQGYLEIGGTKHIQNEIQQHHKKLWDTGSQYRRGTRDERSHQNAAGGNGYNLHVRIPILGAKRHLPHSARISGDGNGLLEAGDKNAQYSHSTEQKADGKNSHLQAANGNSHLTHSTKHIKNQNLHLHQAGKPSGGENEQLPHSTPVIGGGNEHPPHFTGVIRGKIRYLQADILPRVENRHAPHSKDTGDGIGYFLNAGRLSGSGNGQPPHFAGIIADGIGHLLQAGKPIVEGSGSIPNAGLHTNHPHVTASISAESTTNLPTATEAQTLTSSMVSTISQTSTKAPSTIQAVKPSITESSAVTSTTLSITATTADSISSSQTDDISTSQAPE